MIILSSNRVVNESNNLWITQTCFLLTGLCNCSFLEWLLRDCVKVFCISCWYGIKGHLWIRGTGFQGFMQARIFQKGEDSVTNVVGFRVSSYCWARMDGIVLLFGCCNLEFNGRVVNVDYWKSGHINNRCFGEMWLLKMEGGFREDIDEILYFVQKMVLRIEMDLMMI